MFVFYVFSVITFCGIMADQTNAGCDQTNAGCDQTNAGCDQTNAGSDQTNAGSDQTLFRISVANRV